MIYRLFLSFVAQDSILAYANLESWATEKDNNYLKWYYVPIVHSDR